ncbi:MAG: ATP-dependent RecD-like DNA helicase [Clostridiales bacterium]|nr:ATP-dependent RecD-like DNA helicase [Clostridiales bacterium]
MTELTCTVERVVFRNDENGFAVVDVRAGKQKTRAVGMMPDVRAGMTLVLKGGFEVNGKFGEQFSVKDYEVSVPTDEESIEDFLGSGVIKGIGPKMAAVIVGKFGAQTFEVLDNKPEKLLQVSGIGKKKLSAIMASYTEHREVTDTVMHFVRLGIGRAAAMKLYKSYGADAPGVVDEDPYRLVREVDGIDFRTADLIAQKLGISGNDEKRVSAGILYILSRAVLDGNTCLPAEEAIDKGRALLDVMGEEIEDAAFNLEFGGGIQRVSMTGGENFWFLSSMYLAEKSVANDLVRLSRALLKPVRAETGRLISETEGRKGIVLSSEQKAAIESSLTSGVFVITGGPGTGKTTIIQAVADILTSCEFELAIAAPTGRAAKRVTEATGYEAKTIHRLLEYSADPEEERLYFGRDSMNPLEVDALIVDEASMIDVLLMEALLDALPSGVRLIIVGDADQLPPVGAGNVLRDILSSERIGFARLTEIYRQAAESLIVTNAHRIDRGEMPVTNAKDGNFFLYRRKDEDSACATIKELCATRLPAYLGIKGDSVLLDIQVVTPVKNRRLGTISLNGELQEALNPPAPGKRELTHGRRVFREGDKVMQVKNDYGLSWIDTTSLEKGEGVFNGDIGFIQNINDDEGIVSVLYDGSRLVRYDIDGLENVELAYAITVHKSQGSEYPCVIMPMMFVPPMLATRNLLYTAVTRGKELVVLVGSEERLRVMVENTGTERRHSALAGFLMGDDGPDEIDGLEL